MSLIKRLELAPHRPIGLPGAVKDKSFDDVIETVRQKILETHASLVSEARMSRERRAEVIALVSEMIVSHDLYVRRLTRKDLADRIVQEMCGLGPIDEFLDDPHVTEIMVNGPNEVYVEKHGRIEKTDAVFTDENHVLDLINRIIGGAGRRVDRSSPYVDARLPDGSRVNAIIEPLAVGGPFLTIRRFPHRYLKFDELVSLGTITPEVAGFLGECVSAKLDAIVSGGSGAGKTTTLNVIANAIPETERVIVIEDSSEIRLGRSHVVYLETRPESVEGKGRVTVRDLLRNALRMRPDRIIIGECRGKETFDLISAMNTGHEGCLSTVHANSIADCLSRLTAMAVMADESVPTEVLGVWIGQAVDVVVQQGRTADGDRVILEIGVVGQVDGSPRATTVYRFGEGFNPAGLPKYFVEKIGNETASRFKRFFQQGEQSKEDR